MNNPLLLVLPALMGTMAVSAYQTAPTDVRHGVPQQSMLGKSPLEASKMALARGAGSACQYGCNDNTNTTCYPAWIVVPGGGTVVDHMEKWVWYEHPECRFAWGADNCNPGPDWTCYRVYSYSAWVAPACSGSSTYYEVKSSSCPDPIDWPSNGTG